MMMLTRFKWCYLKRISNNPHQYKNPLYSKVVHQSLNSKIISKTNRIIKIRCSPKCKCHSINQCIQVWLRSHFLLTWVKWVHHHIRRWCMGMVSISLCIHLNKFHLWCHLTTSCHNLLLTKMVNCSLFLRNSSQNFSKTKFNNKHKPLNINKHKKPHSDQQISKS